MDVSRCPTSASLIAFGEPGQALTPELTAHLARCPTCQTALTSVWEDKDPVAAVLAGRYRLEERVGVGAHGEVWRAVDIVLQRQVAVKLLPTSEVAINAVLRLLREARLLARLSDPNVVRVYDSGSEAGRPYLVAEWLGGGNLAQWLSLRPRSWREVVALFAQAASGLSAAHQLGLTHRDFKPHNIVLNEQGDALVADFGLASVEFEPSGVVPESGIFDISHSGAVGGTLAYMAPELFEGAAASPQSDQFSFFVSLYEALEGVRPFALVWPKRDEMRAFTLRTPRPLRHIITRGLSTNLHHRWPDMAQVRRALLHALDARHRRLTRVTVMVAVLIAAVGGLLVSSWKKDIHCQEVAQHLSWTTAERQQVFDNLSTLFPLSPQSADATRARLEQFETRWHSTLGALCESQASVPNPKWPAQEECLRRQMVRLRTVSQLITLQPETQRSNLTEALADLPRPDSCQTTTMRAPRAGELEGMHALAVDIGRLDTLQSAQDYQRAKAESVTLITLAKARGFIELELEASLSQALAMYYLGEEREVVALITSVLERAEREGLDVVRFHALHALAFLKGARLQKPEEGALLLGQAEAVANRIGAGPRELGELTYTRGVLHFHAGRREAAITSHEDALAKLASIGEQRTMLAMHVYRGLAQAHLWQQRPKVASEFYRQALLIAAETVGTQSLGYASATHDLGTALADNGDLREAYELFTQSAQLGKTLKDGSINSLITRNHLAWLHWEFGKDEQAQQELEALLSDPSNGAQSQRLNVLRGLAQVALYRKDFTQALGYAGELVKYSPASGPKRTRAFCRAGMVNLASGKPHEAQILFAQVLTPELEDGPERWCLEVGRLLAGDLEVEPETLLARMDGTQGLTVAVLRSAVRYRQALTALKRGKLGVARAFALKGLAELGGKTGRRAESYRQALETLQQGRTAPLALTLL